MKIQVNSFGYNYGWNVEREKENVLKNDSSYKEQNEQCFKAHVRNVYPRCHCLLTPALLVITVSVSFLSFYFLWSISSIERLASLGTLQFIDVFSTKYEVDIAWSCCDNHAFGKLNMLQIEPSPINLHENVTLSVDAEVFQDIVSPLSVKLKIMKKVWIWITIPCINSIGSCSYEDICNFSPYRHNSTCVLPLPHSFLPCNCPIKKGKYYAHKSVIELVDPLKYIPKWLKNGRYWMKAEGFSNGTRVGCYKFQVTVRS